MLPLKKELLAAADKPVAVHRRGRQKLDLVQVYIVEVLRWPVVPPHIAAAEPLLAFPQDAARKRGSFDWLPYERNVEHSPSHSVRRAVMSGEQLLS